ncbi:MAG: EAL domain-containing protein, partial [Rhodobacteraceae bacterium]|nr:EAL domain-containing protein [Paracoccaceae bacterium]
AIIQLSHSAGMSVVAQGVERMDQATLLAELNCDMLQGYLFAKPMPLEMCLQYLNEETRSQAKLGYKIA